MKKRILSLLVLPAIIFGSLGLASCGGDNDTTNPTPSEKIDYVKDPAIRLKLDYKNSDGTNRNFFEEGIGQVNLQTVIDGDTAHFKLKDSTNRDLIKIRYYGIDTPESTGSVEPYGEKAKKFNKAKLDKASKDGTIVLTSTCLSEYKKPETDSTGERYLGMIWINEDKKDAPFNELYLLNLYIVQEGYSYAKNVDKFPEFKDIFFAAEQQAKNLKLNLFSGERDDEFNYDSAYETTDLAKIKKEVEANLKDPTHENIYENKKVRVRGTVAGFTNRILYLQTPFINEETGKTTYAGINVFTGMNPISAKYTTYNAFIEVCGLCKTNENFGFQITDAYFPRVNAGDENECKVIYKASETPENLRVNEFKVPAAELNARNDILFSPVNVTEPLTVTGGYASSKGEMTLYCTANNVKTPFNVYVPFRYTPDGDSTHAYDKVEQFVGKTFNIKGIYNFHKTTSGKVNYQLIARTHSDLELIK